MHCSDASLGFEDRFAIFCDQLGDFLEGLVQRAVDVLELFFQLDVADQQVRTRAGSAAAQEPTPASAPADCLGCCCSVCAWTAARLGPAVCHCTYAIAECRSGDEGGSAAMHQDGSASNNTAAACCLGLQLALHAALTNVTLFHTLILVAGRPVPHPTPPPVFCGGRGGRWPAQNDGLRHLPV
jgi:hypothetical protein